MHFLNAVVTTCLVLALALPAMAITKPSTPACVANSKKVYSSLPESFQLILLAIDNDGKIDLQASNPVIDYDYYNSAWSHIKTLIFEPANLAASAFSLKNKKLIVYGNEAALMPQPFDVHSVGLETPAFNSSTIPGSVPINFTAVPACDSYGRGFLRLTEAGRDALVLQRTFPSGGLLQQFVYYLPSSYIVGTDYPPLVKIVTALRFPRSHEYLV